MKTYNEFFKNDGLLITIKATYPKCFNNSKSSSFGNPYRDLGTFKTTTMVLCHDNKRRRVWCKATVDAYMLYVNVDGERLALANNNGDFVSFGMIHNLENQ